MSCLQRYTPSRTLRSASDNSVSRCFTPDSTVGCHAFSVFGPSTWNDLPLPFLSNRNPLWIHSIVTEKHSFPKTVDLPCFLFHGADFIHLESPFAASFKLYTLSFVLQNACVCALRTVSMDTVLHFTNTLLLHDVRFLLPIRGLCHWKRMTTKVETCITRSDA